MSETVKVLEHAVTPNDRSSPKAKLAYHKGRWSNRYVMVIRR